MADITPFDRRPDFRRPFSDASLAIPTNDLVNSVNGIDSFYQYQGFPPQQPLFNSLPSDERGRPGRKFSMTDVKPIRAKSGPRAMSFGHLGTHFENTSSPPDFSFGFPIPHRWDNGSSFDTTFDEAIVDSPPDQQDAKKQRRRECHNQVEKRRREHINAKIEELGHLIPAHYQQADDEEEEDDSPKKRKPRRNSMAKKDAGPCKGRVLSHSVQYIQDLRHANDLQAQRIHQLEALLANTSFDRTAPVFYSPNLQQMPASPDTWNNYNFSPTTEKPLPRMRTNSDAVQMDMDVFRRDSEWQQ